MLSCAQLHQEAEANPTIREEEDDWLVGAHPPTREPSPAKPPEPRVPSPQRPPDTSALSRGGRTVSIDKGWRFDDPGQATNRRQAAEVDDVTSMGGATVNHPASWNNILVLMRAMSLLQA